MIPYLRKLFLFDDWANREALQSLKVLSNPPPRSVKFLAHIIGAEWLWLARLNRHKSASLVWPDLTLEQCEFQLDELKSLWKDYLDELTPEHLSEEVAYTNSKGEPWTSRVEDILIHVVIHSAQHRAQIASDLRMSGHEPPYTDFIHCVRQGHLSE